MNNEPHSNEVHAHEMESHGSFALRKSLFELGHAFFMDESCDADDEGPQLASQEVGVEGPQLTSQDADDYFACRNSAQLKSQASSKLLILLNN